MSRGNQRQNIFRDNADRLRFVSTLGEACQKTGWQAHAYCLMRNHFHWVIEIPSVNLVTGMSQMEAVRSLIPRFEAKIQRVIDRVWGTQELLATE